MQWQIWQQKLVIYTLPDGMFETRLDAVPTRSRRLRSTPPAATAETEASKAFRAAGLAANGRA